MLFLEREGGWLLFVVDRTQASSVFLSVVSEATFLFAIASPKASQVSFFENTGKYLLNDEVTETDRRITLHKSKNNNLQDEQLL